MIKHTVLYLGIVKRIIKRGHKRSILLYVLFDKFIYQIWISKANEYRDRERTESYISLIGKCK